jgi:hypothetical protein
MGLPDAWEGGAPTVLCPSAILGRRLANGQPETENTSSAEEVSDECSRIGGRRPGHSASARLRGGDARGQGHAGVIVSVDDLAADTFGSDAELEEFLAFTRAERHSDEF